jgi:hypothetical protein
MFLFVNKNLNIYIIDNSIDNEILKLLNNDFKNRIFNESSIDKEIYYSEKIKIEQNQMKFVKFIDKSFDLIYLNKDFDLTKIILKERFIIIYNENVKDNLEKINELYKFKNINLNLHFLKDYFFKYLIKFDNNK